MPWFPGCDAFVKSGQVTRTQAHGTGADFLNGEIAVQLLAPAGVIEGLALNQGNEALGLDIPKMLSE
jgi:hypothetical protein